MEIQQVAMRPDGGVEVTYSEDRDSGPSHILLRTLVFDSQLIPTEFAEFLDDAQTMVDAALVAIRNPKPTLSENEESE